jgi:tripartite ATP-independent transporter DctM subunit
MVIYAWQANISLGDLFWAGIVPGLVMAAAMMIATGLVAARKRYPKDAAFRLDQVWREFRRAFWALAMPVLILVGFRLGVFTATEIAGVVAVYALIVGKFIYRTLSWSSLPRLLLATARETAVILVIVAAAAPFSWIMGIEQAPQVITALLKQLTSDPWVLLVLLNVVLLVVGMFMETLAIMIILVPILIPVLNAFQIDLVHFGIVLLVNLVIGQLTPPVGVLLFVAGSISHTPFAAIVRQVWPFLIALIVALAVLTFFPGLSLWLPGLINH